MHCPHCIEELKLAERKGIEIDYCPNCRGVWLDRGELDKIIERSIEAYAPSPSANREEFTPREQSSKPKKSKKSKKGKIYRSVLEELFDF